MERKIGAIEVVDHGIDHAQYFQGCGVAFTSYTEVATGCGDNPAEALDDLLESIAQNGWDVERLEAQILEDLGLNVMPHAPSVADELEAEGDDGDGCELYYYLSLRWTPAEPEAAKKGWDKVETDSV